MITRLAGSNKHKTTDSIPSPFWILCPMGLKENATRAKSMRAQLVQLHNRGGRQWESNIDSSIVQGTNGHYCGQ